MEQFNFWIQAIISILSGVAVLVPLMIKLIQFVQAGVKEKNWSKVLKLVMSLMADAEDNFESGAEKKEWVMGQLKALAGSIDYDIDWVVISEMIDKICDVSKEINI